MKKIYIIAVFLAIVTAIAAYSFGKSLEAEAKPPEVLTASVVVTTTEIGEGVFITPEMVQLKAVPIEYAAAGAATALRDVVGKVNKYRCMANQQVTLDQLGSVEDASITEGGRLSYTLNAGMRAMTVYTTEITGVAGYVNPGDRVDIVCTINVPGVDELGNAISTPTSMMLLENVNVLETGIITAKLAEGEEAEQTVYTSLTIEVEPADAVRIQYAVSYGQLSFLLRAVDDMKLTTPASYIGTESAGGN